MNMPATRRPEPMLLLVLGIPALTVVAGVATVLIANHRADSVVADDYRKDGLAINLDPARDRAAARLGVSARVAVDARRLRVELAPGTSAAPARLLVLLSHATRAELDRMLTLTRAADGGYQAPLEGLGRGHWYLELTPVDRSWRLTGEFLDGTPALALRPRA